MYPENLRCGHCGTRHMKTYLVRCWGFPVRLCDDCIRKFWKILRDFLPERYTAADVVPPR